MELLVSIPWYAWIGQVATMGILAIMERIQVGCADDPRGV